ncbi:hypothetical protein EJ08DRAFT_689043 [Tothia fuscella]|uniref:DUF7580 domain-containing protein n=1 Tax=Tothia fuscella TaxID=1048955 RepID=A0A9P4NM10_9PEZI|nr:hypothetical protein EJ08DRAFT_689043 [Tothia fuscella]
MATGIEIAGLVLGALPPVIFLGVYHTSFEQTMQRLLQSIADGTELNDMLENTNSIYWTDPVIDEALRNKLGKAYSSFFRKTQDTQAIVIALAGKLNINGVDRITHEGLEAIITSNPPAKQKGKPHKFEFREDLKFTMKRQRIKKHLEDLRSAIETLDTLYDKAERLEEPYRPAMRSRSASPVKVIADHACRLYDVLSRTWCSAHTSHSAGLLLEQRLVRRRKQEWPGLQKQADALECSSLGCFEISLLQTPPTKWLDIEFRVAEEDIAVTKTKSRVTVIITEPTVDPLMVPSSIPPPYADPSKLQEVSNLCSELEQPVASWIGFCLDSKNRLRGAYTVPSRSVTYVSSGVNLADILATTPLGRTPRLMQSCEKEDILFLRAKLGSTCVDIQHPFLTRKPIVSHTKHVRRPGHDGSKLLSLGIMLLEVYSGECIESLRDPSDVMPHQAPNEMSNLSAARRWLLERENSGDISFAFRTAISHCLKCFVDPVADLDNEEFSRTIQEQILAPLEEEMNMLLYGPVSRRRALRSCS